MPTVLLTLTINRTRAFRRVYGTHFLPPDGSVVVLFAEREDPAVGPSATVKSHLWHDNGGVGAHMGDHSMLNPGDFIRRLLDAGWQES